MEVWESGGLEVIGVLYGFFSRERDGSRGFRRVEVYKEKGENGKEGRTLKPKTNIIPFDDGAGREERSERQIKWGKIYELSFHFRVH